MNHLLLCVVLLVSVTFSLQKSSEELDELEEILEKITEECMDEFKIQDLPDYSEDSKETDMLPRNVQCFTKCRHVKKGLMLEDGKLEMRALEKLFEPLAKCHEIEGNDDCETAYKIDKCLREAFDELAVMLQI